jgi:hypothetical protein
MTIEQKLDRMIELLETISNKLIDPSAFVGVAETTATPITNKPAPKKDIVAELAKEEAAKQDAASKEPTTKPQPPKEEKITKEKLADAVRAAVSLRGADPVRNVIKTEFGVERASLAPEDKWAQIITRMKAL